MGYAKHGVWKTTYDVIFGRCSSRCKMCILSVGILVRQGSTYVSICHCDILVDHHISTLAQQKNISFQSHRERENPLLLALPLTEFTSELCQKTKRALSQQNKGKIDCHYRGGRLVCHIQKDTKGNRDARR